MRGLSHVAAIQDGNRRWAEERGQKPYEGHQEGVETTRSFLRWCAEEDIEEVTIYALSTENLSREEGELQALFDLFEQEFRDAARDEEVHGYDMRIRCLGLRELLPERVLEAARFAEEATADNEERVLNVALGYGGRAEIVRSLRRVADEGEAGDVEEVAERLGGGLLPREGSLQDVDLLIRTGDEKRTSNFLPWQSSGSRCVTYFSEKMWPEFSREDFDQALDLFEEVESGAEGESRAVPVVRG